MHYNFYENQMTSTPSHPQGASNLSSPPAPPIFMRFLKTLIQTHPHVKGGFPGTVYGAHRAPMRPHDPLGLHGNLWGLGVPAFATEHAKAQYADGL